MAGHSGVSKKRILAFGPGTIIALALIMIFGFSQYQKKATGVKFPSPLGGVPTTDSRGPVPELGFLLTHKYALNLAREQVKSLKSLESEWDRESGPLEKSLNREAGKLESFLRNHNSAISANDLTRAAAPVSELSSKLASLRHNYWERGLTLLTPDQIRKLDQERIREFSK